VIPALLVAALLVVPIGNASSGTHDVSVRVDRSRISTELGKKFTFRSTVTNSGATTARGLIAHLNVLSLRNGVYVDPEDWSSNRTRYLGAIPAGRSITTTWHLQAVNDGTFAVYVAVLPDSGIPRPPTTAPTIHLDVASRKTLNAGGMLPLALGIPACLGLLALGVRIRRRG
jgi:hypothetical protein